MRPRLLLLTTVLPLLLHSGSAVATPECTCDEGRGTYAYLASPVVPPDDPSHCPLDAVAPGKCPRTWPSWWDDTCGGNGRMRCFLRRHAASWGLVCSERIGGGCDCKNPHPEHCPGCGGKGHAWGDADFDEIRRQVEIEGRRLSTRRPFIVIRSPHFYVVTDIPQMKAKPRGRNPRLRTMEMHEIAHLYAQRAELAYDEFVATFGDRITLPRPCAIYLLEKDSTKEAVAQASFGLPKPELIYGGDVKSIAGGYAYNGMAISLQKYSGRGRLDVDDHAMHFQMRHLLGHILCHRQQPVPAAVDLRRRGPLARAAASAVRRDGERL
jgi:hypothetical protein